ncbi:MAG: hypothetical protein CL590_04270 [Alteromonadaceae bacterium]|nr:hypothetical protein [Alteromonadaceae bacterium]|tara:strand:+ start:7439 stop:7984 length:546 start_codon:yes stop_codon:yes gene_type:complete
MSKNTVALKERNEAKSEEVFKALKEKIIKLEDVLDDLRANPLGNFSQLTSVVKLLEFEGYDLPNLITSRTTLSIKHKDLKKLYENLASAVKEIKEDPASIDPLFTSKVREALRAEFQPEIDVLNAEVEKYAELLTAEQAKRQVAEESSRRFQKEIRRLEKQIKLANEKIRTLTADGNIRSV